MLGGADRVLINQIPETWLNSPSVKGLLQLKGKVRSLAQIEPRRGSFEIYANIGAPLNETRIICLHSKLESGRFPRRELIVEVALLAMADVALGEPLDVVEQNCLAFYANEDIEEYRGKSRRYYDLAVIQSLVKEAA